MGAEVAVRSGAGEVVLDVRRGDGPEQCFDYTFASLAATDGFVAKDVGRAAAIVRALRRAQGILAEDPERAASIGERLFPPEQASLIAELVRRDAPYYEAEISERAIGGMKRLARERDLLKGDPAYEEIVAEIRLELRATWPSTRAREFHRGRSRERLGDAGWLSGRDQAEDPRRRPRRGAEAWNSQSLAALRPRRLHHRAVRPRPTGRRFTWSPAT